MTLEEVAPGRARMSMTVQKTMANGQKVCHGGFIFTLADTAFGFACNTHNQRAVSASCSIDYLAPAFVDDRLTAEASEVERRGRRGIYDVKVINQKRRDRRALPGPVGDGQGDVGDERLSARADRESPAPPSCKRCSCSACNGRSQHAYDNVAALPQEIRRGRREAGGLPLARGSRALSVHHQGRPARHLSVRHVRRADGQGGAHPRLLRHHRQAHRRRLHREGHRHLDAASWRARSAPPARARATRCTSPTATACSPAASARITAPSASASR